MDRDGQRAGWRSALRRHALDRTDRQDFALAGLASRLSEPSVQLLVLPSDPELEVMRVDDDLWAWAKNFLAISVDGRNVRLGTQQIPTARAAALVDSYGSREPWNSYVAVHRSGALEYGLGSHGAWERDTRDGTRVRVFNLITVVGRTWALLKFGSKLHEWRPVDGPFQLTVAARRTGGAFLGNVGAGWAEPLSIENDLPGCPDSHLLWHLEIEQWPEDDDAIREIAFGVGDRLEDAWGVQQRRYLARTGDRPGRFDIGQLRE